MPRGGPRPGSGPKKGTKYRKRFQLQAAPDQAQPKLTQAQRMAAMKRQVAIYVHAGMTEDEIAVVMKSSVEDLRAVFGHELQYGIILKKAEELLRLDAASAAGSVAASKTLLAAVGGGDQPTSPAKSDQQKETRDEKVTRLALHVLQGGSN